jgi:hypothetical protein
MIHRQRSDNLRPIVRAATDARNRPIVANPHRALCVYLRVRLLGNVYPTPTSVLKPFKVTLESEL